MGKPKAHAMAAIINIHKNNSIANQMGAVMYIIAHDKNDI